MTCQRQPDGSVKMRQLNAFEYHTLWELPSLADPQEHEGARRRLFPPPYLPGEATPELNDDWEEFVRPDLEEQLGETFARVLSDLEKAEKEEPGPSQKPSDSTDGSSDADDEMADEGTTGHPAQNRLRWAFDIPKSHVEDWFRAMNAARLVMSARYECHRQDMDYVLNAVNNGQTARLVQYELLTGLCHWWVSVIY